MWKRQVLIHDFLSSGAIDFHQYTASLSWTDVEFHFVGSSPGSRVIWWSLSSEVFLSSVMNLISRAVEVDTV